MCVGVVILNALFFSQGGMINIADYTQNLFRSVCSCPACRLTFAAERKISQELSHFRRQERRSRRARRPERAERMANKLTSIY
jgi:hypothetical protein